MLTDGLGKRTEDDPQLASFSLKVVATETLSNTASTATPASSCPLLQRNTKLVIGLQQLRIDLVQALGPSLLAFGAA